MSSWRASLREGVLIGAVASLTSTAALAWCGRCENGAAPAPTNATSHWLWGARAMREDKASARYTGIGYAIHHLSATFWAVIYTRLFSPLAKRGAVAPAAAGAALVSGAACLVDYTLTPPRLRPGYEQRLSIASLSLVYAAFGAGLLAGAVVQSRIGKRGRTPAPDRSVQP